MFKVTFSFEDGSMVETFANAGDPIPGIAHAVVIEQYRVPDMM